MDVGNLSSPSVYAENQALLGEGACWHRSRRSLFWVDILKGLVFEKTVDGEQKFWGLGFYVSAVFEREGYEEEVFVLSERGLLVLSLETGHFEVIHPLLGLETGLRTNDAGIDPKGNLIYGTMFCDPECGLGAVYRVSPDGAVDVLVPDVRIPNTFRWSSDGSALYFADSAKATMYQMDYETGECEEFFVLAGGGDVVPDGSDMDELGRLWTACWGGSCIRVSDSDGRVVSHISLNAVNPTSCCFGEGGKLYVTSATEGLSASDLALSEDSGSVFVIETGMKGAVRPFLKVDNWKSM